MRNILFHRLLGSKGKLQEKGTSISTERTIQFEGDVKTTARRKRYWRKKKATNV